LSVFKIFNQKEGSQAPFWITIVKWLMTFYLVLIGWVFFRAENMDSALTILINMHTFSSDVALGLHAKPIFVMVFVWLWLVHIMDYFVLKGAAVLESKPWLYWILMILGQAICLFIGEPSNEFIYFQF
ncbi:MAG: MBOAT family protein, partial [Kangiellaceae bacterium]